MIAAGAGGDRRAASGAAVPRTSVSAPHTTASARIPTPDPHGARDRVARHFTPDANPHPEQPDGDDRERRRQIFGPDETGEAPSADGGGKHGRHVMPDHDAGDCPQEQAFNDRCRDRDSLDSAAEGTRHARHDTTRHEQRPAFNVDGAHERRDDRSGQDEPGGRVANRRRTDAGYEEGRHAELRDRQCRGFPHRQERYKRGRRQNDADRVTGRLRWEQIHGTFGSAEGSDRIIARGVCLCRASLVCRPSQSRTASPGQARSRVAACTRRSCAPRSLSVRMRLGC